MCSVRNVYHGQVLVHFSSDLIVFGNGTTLVLYTFIAYSRETAVR